MGDAGEPGVCCPVCGQPVDPAAAPSLTYRGKIYYFKGQRCLQRFLQAPELFVGAGDLPQGSRQHGGCCR